MVFVQDVIAIPDTILENAADIIGQKALTRSILQQLKLPVPKAFVVTPAAFYHFLNYQNGLNKWRAIVDNAQVLSPENMVSVSQQLQKLVRNHPVDPKLAGTIGNLYRKIIGNHWAHLTISPTSHTQSPVNLPLPIIKGETALIDFLRQIWSAQLTPHSLSLQLVNQQNLIQLTPIMVSSHETALVSGTISTVEPTTQNKNAMLIEAIFGTNPQTDQKHVPADLYVVDRSSKTVISRRYQAQASAVIADYFGHYKSKRILPSQQFAPKLNDQQIGYLLDAASKIHSHQLSPQKINWLITKSGVFFTRFEKLDSQAVSGSLHRPRSTASNRHLTQIANGLIASPGICTAPLVRISSNTPSLAGKIVLITEPNPNLLPKLRQAAGIIIESGGITSEISLAARDIGIPTLVGTGRISLSDGQVITLDAIKGNLFVDKSAPKSTPVVNLKTKTQLKNSQPLATKLYLSLNQISESLNYAYQQAAGVGELRGNDLVLSMGIHPKRILDRHLPAFKTDFTQKLTQVSHLFGDRPVYYHPVDLPTNVARKLEHGPVYEPILESNTHFGFRGAFRAAADPNLLKTELDLLADLRHKSQLKNLSLCLPLVRSATEFAKVKRMTAAAGLFRSPSFKLAVKIGTPAATSFIPQIATEGADSLILDLDLLTTLVLGYDPDSSEVDQELNPTAPSVIEVVSSIINVADAQHLPVIIAGYSLCQSAELINAVIKAGASNLIINSPQFDQVKVWIAQAEVRLITHSNNIK